VFLHGIGGGSGIWIRQVKAFQKHYNLLLIDLPGHGHSAYGLQDLSEHSFPVIAKEVLKVLDHEKIENAHFVGISLGTIIIQALHDLSPERVDSMILGGAVERMNVPAKMIIKVANVLKNFMPYMWLYKISALILMPKERHRESRHAFIREAYKLGRTEFLHWYSLHTQIEQTILRVKKKITFTPKLYIMGSEDYMFLPHIKNNLNKARNEGLQIIEKCGHVCNIERHKEFNELGLAFLLSQQRVAKVAQ
jgi:pimeloyl-ACP methyl ester carboxylesterase